MFLVLKGVQFLIMCRIMWCADNVLQIVEKTMRSEHWKRSHDVGKLPCWNAGRKFHGLMLLWTMPLPLPLDRFIIKNILKYGTREHHCLRFHFLRRFYQSSCIFTSHTIDILRERLEIRDSSMSITASDSQCYRRMGLNSLPPDGVSACKVWKYIPSPEYTPG